LGPRASRLLLHILKKSGRDARGPKEGRRNDWTIHVDIAATVQVATVSDLAGTDI
jgi:hypothetical protein